MMSQRASGKSVRFAAMAGVFLASVAGAPGVGAENPDKREVQASVDRAVDRGLRRLRDLQNPSGSWGQDSGASAAITSLSVMAFMSRGHLPGQGEYGDGLNKGVDYVLEQQDRAGLITSENAGFIMYGHGISTVMLCEAYGMVSGKTGRGADRRKAVETAVARSVRVILAAQQVPKAADAKGGWRYLPTSVDSDISVTGWQLMALRGAGNVGANIPQRALDEGVAYIMARHIPNGGFSYMGNEGGSSGRTGTGITALELLGKHNTPQALNAGQALLNAVQNQHDGGISSPFYYYSVYYCAQAANQLGDKYDDQINGYIRNALLKSQKESGAWQPATGEYWGTETYATAMAILALTVQNHYLPLYQR
jgi:hypothetical protein